MELLSESISPNGIKMHEETEKCIRKFQSENPKVRNYVKELCVDYCEHKEQVRLRMAQKRVQWRSVANSIKDLWFP